VASVIPKAGLNPCPTLLKLAEASGAKGYHLVPTPMIWTMHQWRCLNYDGPRYLSI